MRNFDGRAALMAAGLVLLWLMQPAAGHAAEAADAVGPVERADLPVPPEDAADSTDLSDILTESVAIATTPTVEEIFVGPPQPEHTSGKLAEKVSKRPRVAEDVDLSEPVPLMPKLEALDGVSIPAPAVPAVRKYSQPSLLILDSEVEASTSVRLSWSPDNGFESIAVPTPVLVVNGAHAGPTMCITAAVHGDELNGIEVVRRVLYDLDPEKLTGAVIGVPIVNLQGFRRGSRYLPDRRDLNRFFPGNTNGSSASRLAHSFFHDVIRHCDALVDVHTGSFHRTNLPQLRADLGNPAILELTENFGTTVVLHSPGATGTLRRAASDAGIPSVTIEAGEPARLQVDAVSDGARGIMTLLDRLDMYDKKTRWRGKQFVYRRSKWERADRGGVLFSQVELGEEVERDQVLGTITDPITNVKSEIRATHNGRILGMALPQFVMPGFAAYRIGIESPIMMDVADPGMPSDSDDVLDVELGMDTLGSADEFDGEDEETFDRRDYAEDSE